jgi:hypothetical protein
MPTTGPEEPHNGETSVTLDNLFNDDDDAEMMLIDNEQEDKIPTSK